MKRKIKLNEHYFDIIDSEEKAYFLGFLWADGCNILHRNRITISLHEKDYDILKKLNDLVFENNTITIRKKENIRGHYINNKFCKNTGDIVSFSIYSKYMSNLLNSYGLIPRKSSIVEFPKESIIPLNLQKHFIRGYFDGDGSIIKHNTKNRGYSIKIASSEIFCQKLKDIIFLHTNLFFYNYNVNDKYSTIQLGGTYNSMIFCKWLYENSNIYMNRKYQKYKDVLVASKKIQKAKYKYIYFDKKNNSWIADVYLGNKKTIRLGNKFPTELSAYEYQQNYINSFVK